jgi:drug/metabolite transporter (DMT)-like permease
VPLPRSPCKQLHYALTSTTIVPTPGTGPIKGAPEGQLRKGSLRETLLLSIPSFFDLVATVLMNIGLLSVTASVYQMMRGAEMLFAALFTVVFLHRHLNKFHYLGITCCGVGEVRCECARELD